MMDLRILFAVIIAVIVVILGIIWFVKLPSQTKIENVKEWLRYAVTIAEKELGSGTGQLKLRMVYDMAISKYSWIAQVIPFTTFSNWVDEALDWSKEQLKTNQAIETFVKGEQE